MFRLFKLFFILIILAAAYFALKQHTGSPSLTSWQSTATHYDVQLKFPAKPMYAHTNRTLPIIGPVNLHIYQHQAENEVFAYIELKLPNHLKPLSLAELEPAVFMLNDTQNLTISHKHLLTHPNHTSLDYVTEDTKGNIIYCRTITAAEKLMSIIYISTAEHFSKQRHKQFFDALRW